ncbi:MAG: diacylglycerol kinase [Methanoregulaceae archaeon]|nr:diacylglycerol kinase [Methanoregulaceae archaeon]
MSVIPKRDLIGPVKVAISGMVYTFRTQRHMRFHLYVVLAVTLMGLLFNLSLREMLVLLFVISLVLVAEMFNSAIEATVDLVQPNYHPMAKFAKDISAGAVLITTIVALVVGTLMLLGPQRWESIKINLTADSPSIPFVPRLITGGFLVLIIVIIGKGLGKRGQVLKGGLVSGHAAFGFFLATGIMFLTDQLVVAGLGLVLAAIIAQSRWEAKIHSIFELSLGAAVGVMMGLLLFGLMPK